MADGDISACAKIPFAMTDTQRIPTPRYYDEAFYALETERLCGLI